LATITVEGQKLSRNRGGGTAEPFGGPRGGSPPSVLAHISSLFTAVLLRVAVPLVCPACQAQSPDGAGFRVGCGRPLFAPPPGEPRPEQVVGEIPQAFTVLWGWGPVRLAFTDRHMFVINTGEHSLLPSPRLYSKWKAALPVENRFRFMSGPWQTPAYPIRWAFDNGAISGVNAHTPHGIGVDRDVGELDLSVYDAGIVVLPGPVPSSRGGVAQFCWRIPGDVDGLRAFLCQLPFGAVVRRH